MFEFHTNKQTYFNWQYYISRDYVLPFATQHLDKSHKLDILEIGCAEAGVLKAFTDLGHQCMGIELESSRLENAQFFMKEAIDKGLLRLLNKNIYDIDVAKDIGHKFDLIILKDVIEHIPNQEKFIPKLKEFLKPGGKVFFAFPPWYMPFGGHQQLCQNKFLSKMPYYHLLPTPMYKGVLRMGKEAEAVIDGLVDIKETGISVERFERICIASGFSIVEKKYYFKNPIYQYKFNWKVSEQARWISAIPFVRNFFTTCAYYVIG